nr:MAG TPA: hypothetical protein [Caudoviricetes sp.]
MMIRTDMTREAAGGLIMTVPRSLYRHIKMRVWE